MHDLKLHGWGRGQVVVVTVTMTVIVTVVRVVSVVRAMPCPSNVLRKVRTNAPAVLRGCLRRRQQQRLGVTRRKSVYLGDEVRGPALDGVRREGGVRLGRRAVGVARGRGAAREEARARRLGEDDLDVRAALLDGLARAVEGTASAVAGDPVVEPLALEAVEGWGER